MIKTQSQSGENSIQIIITSAYIALFYSKRFTVLSIITQASGFTNKCHLNTPGCIQQGAILKDATTIANHSQYAILILAHLEVPYALAWT